MVFKVLATLEFLTTFVAISHFWGGVVREVVEQEKERRIRLG